MGAHRAKVAQSHNAGASQANLMGEENDVSEPIWRSVLTVWPLVVAFVVSVGFGYFAFVLSTELTTHDGTETTRWQQFLQSSPNEMGDTLAGFVGSLTLIWVVASVIQQSMELRAQRREFTEMVKAQDAQVKALNAQAAILEDERTIRREDRASRELEALLSRAVNQIRLMFQTDERVRWIFDAGHYFKMRPYGSSTHTSGTKFDGLDGTDEFFVVLYRNLENVLHPKKSLDAQPFRGQVGTTGVTRALALLGDVELIVPELPPDQRHRLDGIFFHESCQLLRAYLESPDIYPIIPADEIEETTP